MHTCSSHIAGRGIHSEGRERGPSDSVTPGSSADSNNAIARNWAAQDKAFRTQTNTASEHQRIGRKTLLVHNRSSYRGQTNLVPVIGNTGNHAIANPLRMQNTLRKILRTRISWPETQNVGNGNRISGNTEHIANDSTYAGIGSAEGFNGGGMIMGFHLDGNVIGIIE